LNERHSERFFATGYGQQEALYRPVYGENEAPESVTIIGWRLEPQHAAFKFHGEGPTQDAAVRDFVLKLGEFERKAKPRTSRRL
jgi:hypothetical protein